VIDDKGTIRQFSLAAQRVFGYESHEITALNFNDLFAPESQRTALDYLDGLLLRESVPGSHKKSI
jgi:PAS domain S-box-containing protein